MVGTNLFWCTTCKIIVTWISTAMTCIVVQLWGVQLRQVGGALKRWWIVGHQSVASCMNWKSIMTTVCRLYTQLLHHETNLGVQQYRNSKLDVWCERRSALDTSLSDTIGRCPRWMLPFVFVIFGTFPFVESSVLPWSITFEMSVVNPIYGSIVSRIGVMILRELMMLIYYYLLDVYLRQMMMVNAM